MNPAPPYSKSGLNAVKGNEIELFKMQYFVYILRSLRSGTLYIGCTSNLCTRLADHQKGQSRATKGKGPWELIYYVVYRHQEDAYKREQSLKQFGGAYRQLKKRLSCELSAFLETHKIETSLSLKGGDGVKFYETNPPRTFEVGFDIKRIIKDCGMIKLSPDEQVTFVTESGNEYDLTRKNFGFYATPSLNGRLKRFDLRAVLVKNRHDQFFIILVEKGKEPLFDKYIEEEKMDVVVWMDNTEVLSKLDNT